MVPSFSSVDAGAQLASPQMTWRRLQRVESACGSSRVLTIGRFRVVWMPSRVSMKSARWESWYPGSPDIGPSPTRPEPTIVLRVTKNGTRAATRVSKGTARSTM